MKEHQKNPNSSDEDNDNSPHLIPLIVEQHLINLNEDLHQLINQQSDGSSSNENLVASDDDENLIANEDGSNQFIVRRTTYLEDLLGSLDNSNNSQFNHNAPLDQFNFTYLIFYLLGTTTMTPWNFFVTAEDYWLYKFRNVTLSLESNFTPLQKSFIADLTVTASISGTIFLILNAIYGHLISIKFKIMGSMIIILGFFIVTTCFIEINTDKWQNQFFILTLITVVFMNTFSALMTGGLFGIAGLFPSEYMTAAVSGQSLGGIFTALAFILALTFNAAPKTTALIYFLIGNTILIISIICYAIMSRTTYFKYHVVDKNRTILKDEEILDNSDDNNPDIVNNSLPDAQPELRVICSKIYVYAIVETLALATSLCVYPAITVLIESENHGSGHKWNDVYFLPVVNYLIFNSGDYLGRILAGLWKAPKNNSHLCLMFTIIRFGFIPCFLLCNSNHVYLPTYITSDATLIVIMILFAISNGYLVNIALIKVPECVMQHEKEMASAIMAACMSIGIAIGACCSMFLVQIL